LSIATLGLAATIVVTVSDDITGVPVGGFPVTVAVFTTWPASTSAWVSVYVAVQVVLAPGISVATGQETVKTFGSATAMLVSVTLPVFETWNVYPIVEPAMAPDGDPACLSIVMAGLDVTGASIESLAVNAGPLGGVAVTVAELATWPASMSVCSSVYEAVQVVLAPGANEVTGQLTVPTLASAIAIAVRVTLPVLATANVYGIVEPAVRPLAVPACLSIVMAGVDAIGVSVESVADAGCP
jgi:hypothetical protein